MKVKKVFLSFFGVIFTVVLAGFIYLLTFDINSYKGLIERKASDALGYQVKILGSLSMNKSFSPVVQATNVQIMTTDTSVPVVVVPSLSMSVNLKPLMNKIIDIQEIKADGVQINLQVNKDGIDNFTKIVRPQTAPVKPEKSVVSAGWFENAQLMLHDFSLTNLNISYEDMTANARYELAFPAVKISQLSKFSADVLYGDEKIKLEGTLSNLLKVLKTKRDLNFAFAVQAFGADCNVSVSVSDLAHLNRNIVLNIALKGKDINKTLSSFIPNNGVPAVDFDGKLLVTLSPAGLLFDTSMGFVGQKVFLDADGDLALSHEALTRLNAKIHFETQENEYLSQYRLNPFSLDAALEYAANKLSLTNIQLMADETDVDGAVLVSNLDKVPQIKAQLHSRYFDFSDIVAEPEEVIALPEEEVEQPVVQKDFDFSLMDKFNLEGRFDIENLSVDHFLKKYPSVLLAFKTDSKSARLEIQEGTTFADGKLIGLVTLERDGQEANITSKFIAEDVRNDSFVFLSKVGQGGLTKMNANLTTKGQNWKQFVKNLDGHLLLISKEFEINTQKMPKKVADLLSMIMRKQDRRSGYFFVKNMVVNTDIKDGILYLDEKVVLETNVINFVLDGTVNFIKKQLDVGLKSSLTKGRISDKITPLSKLIRVVGDWNNPAIELDVLNATLSMGVGVLTEPADLLPQDAFGIQNPTEVALKGTNFETIDMFFGRERAPIVLANVETTQKPAEQPKTKAQLFGEELLDALTDALDENKEVPVKGKMEQPAPAIDEGTTN